ncbi:MAG TPA: SDR family oxidoreductase [Terriglobales bacterium]|nr:SDR family oxidoreductase [Terriglobales bacterium]
MDTGLKDRAVIVAASSQGMGRAAAGAFAAEGACVALCARNESTLASAAEEIRRQHGVRVLAQPLDVTQGEAVAGFVETVVREFGRLDVCVTNAGGPPAKNFLATTPDDWQKAVAQNFLSVVHFARAVLPHMQRNRWGRLITITSVSVKQPIPDLVLSNAVRAAVVGLVKSLANEFGKDGITVNNVAPGYTATDRLKELAATRALAAGISVQEMYDRWAADVPLRRIGRPEEVADAILWLASERASYITGQTLLVDGGSYKGL